MIATSTDTKACRVCSQPFLPFLSTQVVCGVKCAKRVPVLARKAAVADRKQTRARLDELRPLGYWVKQAQTAFNAWIRWRDRNEACISCDDKLTGTRKFMAGQYDAGHFLTVGARPELRFDEDNVHKQCKQCNLSLHGNALAFRAGLIKRRGIEVVDRLEGPHPPLQLRADDLKRITAEYRARLKAAPAEVF